MKLELINTLKGIRLDIAEKEQELAILYLELRANQKLLDKDVLNKIENEAPLSLEEQQLYFCFGKFIKNNLLIDEKIPRKKMYSNFLDAYPKYSTRLTAPAFKRELIKYCEYANLEFNPPSLAGKDRRIKSNGVEYFMICIPGE